MIYVLFMLLYFHNHTTNNDLSNFGSMCQTVRVVVFKFKGRYLSRRTAHPPYGNFNPFLISNKEAHIVNGNINRETVKVLDDKEHAIRDSTDSICAHEGSNVRDRYIIV